MFMTNPAPDQDPVGVWTQHHAGTTPYLEYGLSAGGFVSIEPETYGKYCVGRYDERRWVVGEKSHGLELIEAIAVAADWIQLSETTD